MAGKVSLRVHAGMLAVATLFSLNYIISKLGMRAFDPIVFAFLRVLGASLILNALLVRDSEPLAREDNKRIAIFGLLGVALNQSLFLAGLALTDAHIAAILITTIPVFTLAVAIVAGRERATPLKIGGIVLAGAGALLVVGGEGALGSARAVIGALLITGNCLAYSLYLVLSRPVLGRLSALKVTARMFAWGAALLVPIAAVPLARESWSTLPRGAWISLVLVIIGPTVTAYVINSWTLRYADASLVAAYVYVQPVLTAALAAMFLHEIIRPIAIVAAAMIFAGVAMINRTSRGQEATSRVDELPR